MFYQNLLKKPVKKLKLPYLKLLKGHFKKVLWMHGSDTHLELNAFGIKTKENFLWYTRRLIHNGLINLKLL